MHRRLIFISLHTPFDPRRHSSNLVSFEIVPVFAIDVAFLAVKVVRIISLVIPHLLFCIKSHLAVFVGAFDLLQLALNRGCQL